MHKKTINLICMAVLVLLSACGQSEEKASAENAAAENGKKTIVLARPAEVDDWYMNKYQLTQSMKLVNIFNSQSDEYVIEERLYDSYDKLFVDMIGGHTPDLLYVGDWIDIMPMYGKELLCDLNELIDNDPDISRDMFVESVLTALEVNGSLYQMPYDFAVESPFAKERLWGKDEDTSFEHIVEKSSELGCVVPFDFSMNSYGFMPYISAEFIDLENGSCSFDDGRFEELIVNLKKYSEALQAMSSPGEENSGFYRFKEDNMLIMDGGGFASFDQLNYLIQEFGEKVKFVGFPSDTYNYHIAVPLVSFAVFSDSENKNGAFEFIKYYTSYEAYIYPQPLADGRLTSASCLPINKEVLDYYKNESIEDAFHFYDDIDEQTRIENANEIMDQINSVNAVSTPAANTVRSILAEELELYFRNNRSAAEVCGIIQSRMTIYLKEQQN